MTDMPGSGQAGQVGAAAPGDPATAATDASHPAVDASGQDQPGHSFSLRQVTAMLGLGRGVVERLVAASFVTPARGPRNQYRFSFQDVILLRTAHGLQAASVPPRKLVQSLRQLVGQLPPTLPLSGLRIQAMGGAVVVRHSGVGWEPLTGQLMLDFEVMAAPGGTVTVLSGGATAHIERSADDWFLHGQALESAVASDRSGAEHAYRRALQLAPQLAGAAANLGALLCEDGRCSDAVAVFDAAVAHCPDDAVLHFNRAIALEDLQRLPEAVASYQQALQLAPSLDDAHYNLARLHQRLGQPHLAIRHYGAYRRSSGRPDAPQAGEPG